MLARLKEEIRRRTRHPNLFHSDSCLRLVRARERGSGTYQEDGRHPSPPRSLAKIYERATGGSEGIASPDHMTKFAELDHTTTQSGLEWRRWCVSVGRTEAGIRAPIPIGTSGSVAVPGLLKHVLSAGRHAR
jgi:hypothetical protein